MIIISQTGNRLLNSENVSLYFLDSYYCDDEGTEHHRISALIPGYKSVEVPLAIYDEEEDAKRVFRDLMNVLTSEKETGQTSYQLE